MTPVRHSLLYEILNFFILCFPHKPRCQHARVLGWNTLFTCTLRFWPFLPAAAAPIFLTA